MPTTVRAALGGATAGPVDEPGPVSEHAYHTAEAATNTTTAAARISLRPIIATPREPGVRARGDIWGRRTDSASTPAQGTWRALRETAPAPAPTSPRSREPVAPPPARSATRVPSPGDQSSRRETEIRWDGSHESRPAGRPRVAWDRTRCDRARAAARRVAPCRR